MKYFAYLLVLMTIAGCISTGTSQNYTYVSNDSKNITRLEYGTFAGISSVDINGKEAYKALADGKERVVYDGKVVGEGLYDGVGFDVKKIGDLPAFDAYRFLNETTECLGVTNPRRHYFIVYNNSRVGEGDFHEPGCKESYGGLHFIAVNNKLAYGAYSDGNGKSFIVYENQRIGTQYMHVSNPSEINKKLAFEATIDVGNYTYKSFIVYDGKEFGKQYRWAMLPSEINGTLSYVATNSENMFSDRFVVYEKT